MRIDIKKRNVHGEQTNITAMNYGWETREIQMAFLFSYGTLQQEGVQVSTFGRTLKGENDNMVGFMIDKVRITNKSTIDISGKEYHPILKYTGKKVNRVPGIAYEVTEEELINADAYEDISYKRIKVSLESGRTAWVYAES